MRLPRDVRLDIVKRAGVDVQRALGIAPNTGIGRVFESKVYKAPLWQTRHADEDVDIVYLWRNIRRFSKYTFDHRFEADYFESQMCGCRLWRTGSWPDSEDEEDEDFDPKRHSHVRTHRKCFCPLHLIIMPDADVVDVLEEASPLKNTDYF